MRLAPVFALLLATLVACRRAEPEPTAGGPALPDRLARLDALGDRAPLVVVAEPAAWTTLHARLVTLLEGVADPAFAQWKSPTIALMSALGEAPGGALEGWDPDGPIVAGLAEPALAGPAGSVVAMLPVSAPQRGFRHTVLLPARAPQPLAAAVRARLNLGKGESDQAFTLMDRPGLGGQWARITAEERWVRVEVATHGDGAPTWAADTPRPPTHTPALEALAQGSAAVGLLVRPQRLNEAYSQWGLRQISAALKEVEPAMRGRLEAVGLAELLAGTLMMDVPTPELGEHAFWLTASAGGIDLAGVVGLTDAGLKAFGAAQAGGGRGVAVRDPSALAVTARFDVGAALEQVPNPPWVGGTARDVATRWSTCGAGCSAVWPLTAPLGMLKGATTLLAPEMRSGMPRTFQLALRFAEGQPQLAFAAEVAADFQWQALQAQLPQAAQLQAVPQGDHTTLMLGWGFDATQAFDAGQAGPAEGLVAVLKADPAQLADGLARQDKALAAVMRRVVRIEGGLAVGQTLAWRLHLALTAEPTAPLVAPLGAVAVPPVRSTSACLPSALRGLAGNLQQLSSDQSATTLVGLQTHLACLELDSALRPLAEGMRRQIEEFIKEFAGAPLAVSPVPEQVLIAAPPTDAVAPPGTGQVKADPAGTAGTDVQQVMRRHMMQYRFCYESALLQDPTLAGRVDLTFSINAQGEVVETTATSATLQDTTVPACVVRVTQRLRFPAQAGDVRSVRFPLVFSPPK